jgi:hypothetical protein
VVLLSLKSLAVLHLADLVVSDRHSHLQVVLLSLKSLSVLHLADLVGAHAEASPPNLKAL